MTELKVTVSIDVPSIEEGLKFFGDVFGFVETARPHPGYAMLKAGDNTIGLLAKPAGSSPAPGSSDVRRYERHWTPVHVDSGSMISKGRSNARRRMARYRNRSTACRGSRRLPYAAIRSDTASASSA